MQIAFIVLALVAGMLMPVQAGINAKLANLVGGAIPSAFVSFLVGTMALGLYLAIAREPVPFTQAWPLSPWWYWIGGTLGAFFVAATVLLAPRIGATSMMALILAGQIVTSLFLDNYGLLGYPEIPISLKRVVGLVLLALGVVLIRF